MINHVLAVLVLRHLVAVAAQFEELCDNPNLVQIFPHPTSCSEYVICFGSVPIMQTCANGLLFNPQLNTCDNPTNVVCGFSCPAEDDPNNPVWLPDSRLEDCARHYLCFQGEPNLFLCPNDLYFDMETRTCTFPQLASCYVLGVFCNVFVTENIPNPRSCTSYYRCLMGFPHFRTCRSNEYFSQALGTCVEGECSPMTTTTMTSAPATSTTEEITSTDEPTTVTTPTTVESTTTSTAMVTIDPNEVCSNYPGVGALPYPDICYMYIFCVNGNGVVVTCPSNQIFIPVILTCKPGNQETCTLGFSG